MKKDYAFFLLTAILFLSCEPELQIKPEMHPPAIILNGNKVDTAYLYSQYNDHFARVEEDTDGVLNCDDHTLITNSTGSLNMQLPGTYYLHYNANDSRGNALAAATRTVHVVENGTTFLNGSYDVACTCTAVAGAISNITSHNYTATVAPNPTKHHFDLIGLHIGAERISSDATLNGSSIEIGFFSPDYDHTNSKISGNLSATKNSFTIDSKFYRYAPRIIYDCRNFYTRQLVINQN